LWDRNGKFKPEHIIKYPGGKRIYSVSSVEQICGIEKTDEDSKKKEDYIYARVSSPKQKEDLERQIKILKEVYPSHKIIKDIGSGLNFKRQGLRTLLDRIYQEKLWSCTKTDCQDLHQDSWSTSLNKLALNSWFTVQAKTYQV